MDPSVYPGTRVLINKFDLREAHLADLAERMAGVQVQNATVNVNGSHVQGMNSKGVIAISSANECAMRDCDAMIVNLTPFRGPSADVGAAYEMGFMRALGRPIFGYSNDRRLFLERVTTFCGGAVRLRATGEHEDADGMAIEPFELHDNLMLAGGIVASGGVIIAETTAHAERYTALAAFEPQATNVVPAAPSDTCVPADPGRA